MTSSDREFFILYFDTNNKRLDHIEQRLTGFEENQRILAENQRVLTEQISEIKQDVHDLKVKQDVHNNLIWGSLGWFTLLLTLLMFVRSKNNHETKSVPQTETKSFLSWENVKELMQMIKHE